MAKLISSTYADALFEMAIEKNKTEDWQKQVEIIKGAFDENPDFSKIMTHPQVPKDEKLALCSEAFDNRVDPEVVGLIRVIIEKDRFTEIDSIFDAFVARVKEHDGIGVCFVTTAKELSEAQKKAVNDKLLETTDYKTMEIHYSVDSALIGGMVIRIGDRVVDSSIRTRLDGLTKELMKAQV